MKITSIKIDNFKSFGEKNNYLGNLSNMNILIGKNNSGKSTVLQILELIFHDPKKNIQPQLRSELSKRFMRNEKEAKVFLYVKLTDNELQYFFPENPFNNILGHYSELRKKLIDVIFTVEINVKSLFSEKTFKIYIEENKNDKNSIENNKIPVINQHLNPKLFRTIIEKNNIILFPAIRKVNEEIGGVQDIRLDPNGKFLTLTVEFIIRDHNQDERIIEESLRDNIKDFFPEMGNFSIAVLKVGENTHISLDHIPMSGYGTGIMDIFLILANIKIREAMGEKINFICIEEPENNLHPSMQKKLLKFLRNLSKNEKQIFISTHSPYFVEPNDIKNLYKLSLVGKDSKISWADHEIIDSLKDNDLLRIIRPNNTTAFFSDKVIFVEGIEDELFLSHIASEFGKSIEETSFIQCNGFGDIPKFKKLFDAFEIKSYIIGDSHCIGDKNFLKSVDLKNQINDEDSDDVKREKLRKNGIFILKRKDIPEYYDPSIEGKNLERCMKVIKQMKLKDIISNSKLDYSEESEFESIFDQIFPEQLLFKDTKFV